MTIEYRDIQEEDKPRWLLLYQDYLEFYEATLSQESKEIIWNSLLSKDVQGVVALVDGEVVGFAHYHFQKSTWADSGHLYLEDLFVDPRFRNLGVARTLILAIENVARKEKCAEMYWITRESNSTARALYDSLANKSDFVRYEIKLKN